MQELHLEATFKLSDLKTSESKTHQDTRSSKVSSTENDVVKILKLQQLYQSI